MFYTRGLRKRLKPRFLHIYLRFFWMELRSCVIHAAIDRSVFNFFWAIPLFFFFFLRHILNLEPDLWRARSPSISLIWSRHPHPPSPIKNPCLTLHLRSQPSPHPPSPIQNPRLTLHLRSQPSPHPSTLVSLYL